MIEAFNNKISLYNGRAKTTATSTPRFLYVGLDYIYAADNDNIVKISQDGTSIWRNKYNTGATAASGYGSQVRGISADYTGSVFVLVWTPSYLSMLSEAVLLKYDCDGATVDSITFSNYSLPLNLNIDKGNNLIVGMSSANAAVYKYDSDLNLIWSFATASESYKATCLDDSDNIFCSTTISGTNSVLRKLNKNGVSQWVTNFSAQSITNMCLDSSNNIWVTGQYSTAGKNVYKFNSSGTLLNSYYVSDYSSQDAYDIVGDISGYLYVSSGAYLYKISSTASIVWSKNPGSGTAYKCVVYRDGFVYFTLGTGLSTYIYNEAGTFIGSTEGGNTINVQLK